MKSRYRLKNGRSIEFLPEYYRFHSERFGHKKSVVKVVETSINAAGSSKNLDYQTIAKKFSKKNSTIKLSGFVSKIVPTYQMIEMFRDTRFEVPYGKTLDIGCGLGIHLRLLKAWGYIAEAVGIDIYDVCSGFNEARLSNLQFKFKFLKQIEKIQDRIARRNQAQLNPVARAVMTKVPTVRNFSKDYGHRPDMSIYDLSFKKKPKVDRLILGNVFDHNEKYDLVTSFASLDWFTAAEIIPKVYDLLNEGGFFYVWVTNWWQSLNTSNIFGHFPFAPQRMTYDEFVDYVKTAIPDHADDIIKSYSYFDPSHPTLADYIEIGNRAGFVPLNWAENVHPETIRASSSVTSLGIAELDPKEFQNALRDIQIISPEIRLHDLLPFSRSMLFYKPPSDKNLKDTLTAALTSEDFHYHPKGPLGKSLKSIAEKIFTT